MRLGEHDLANDDRDRPLQVDIANIVPHPNYNRRYKYYDIALIRMALRVSFNRYMRPACLPESYNTNKEHILASGWGKTYFNQGAAQVLMKVVLEVFTEPECNSSYVNEKRLSQLNQGILPDQQFCAGSHREIKDTCGVRVIFIKYPHFINWVLTFHISLNFFENREILVAQCKNIIPILTVCTQLMA